MATAAIFTKETYKAATELYEDRQIDTFPRKHKLLTALALIPAGTLVAPIIIKGVVFNSEQFRANLRNTWIKRNKTE